MAGAELENNPELFELDRLDSGLEELSMPYGPDTRYQVEKEAPYEIHDPIFNKSPVNSDLAGIAIVDITTEQVYVDIDLVRIKASHYEMVRRALPESDRLIQAYDMVSESSPLTPSASKGLEILKHILNTHEQSGVEVVLYEGANSFNFDGLNSLKENVNDPGLASSERITPENIFDRSGDVRKIFEAYTNGQFQNPNITDEQTIEDFSMALERADVVEDLIKQGVAVIQPGGNEGPNHFPLLGALVPDMIISYGTNEDGLTAHPNSMANSLGDLSFPMNTDVPIGLELKRINKTLNSITLPGTSLGASKATERVARLLDKGKSIQEINQIFRSEPR